jgi:hypothetical protein
LKIGPVVEARVVTVDGEGYGPKLVIAVEGQSCAVMGVRLFLAFFG